MSTNVMKGRITETSPQLYARIGGVLYLIIIVIGFCSEFFVRDKLVSVLRGPITQLMYLPMLAFEVPLGVWLMVKGVAAHQLDEPARQKENVGRSRSAQRGDAN
jgi:hypothetical protein